MTRNNPSPRAYFKCACAPSCSVKKKVLLIKIKKQKKINRISLLGILSYLCLYCLQVQRSVEDQSVLVATYEGEHNHPMSSQIDSNNGLNRYISLGGHTAPAKGSSSSLAEPVTESKKVTSPSRTDFPEVQKLLVEQMASSLTKDPNFTAALAAAVTGRLYQQNQTEK